VKDPAVINVTSGQLTKHVDSIDDRTVHPAWRIDGGEGTSVQVTSS
jgi:hypothetical protein